MTYTEQLKILVAKSTDSLDEIANKLCVRRRWLIDKLTWDWITKNISKDRW